MLTKHQIRACQQFFTHMFTLSHSITHNTVTSMNINDKANQDGNRRW